LLAWLASATVVTASVRRTLIIKAFLKPHLPRFIAPLTLRRRQLRQVLTRQIPVRLEFDGALQELVRGGHVAALLRDHSKVVVEARIVRCLTSCCLTRCLRLCQIPLRDVGMALGFSEETIDRVSDNLDVHATDDLTALPTLRSTFGDQLDSPRWQQWLKLASAIQGYPRHLGNPQRRLCDQQAAADRSDSRRAG
jgi:hypothetical protein